MYQKRYREEHPEANSGNPAKRRSMLKKRYGITDSDYQTMLESQGGRCAICGSLDPRGRGWFCVDHNHATGEVRGLLCAPCNAALGVLERPQAWLDAAESYLERWDPK